MKKKPNKSLGKYIRAQRKKLGISQDALANGLNMQQNGISKMEQGEYVNMEYYADRLDVLLQLPPGTVTRKINRGK